MKNIFWWSIGILVIIVAIIIAWLAVADRPDSQENKVNKIAPLYESAERIIYTTNAAADTALLRQDCRVRGGLFNSCGSSCPPASQNCAEVCAYTCELTGVSAVRIKDQCERKLEFEDYAVTDIYRGAPKAVDFSSYPEAAQFKTAISTAVARGANFAGRYAMAEWGCGTSCQDHALVDVATGQIIIYGLPSFYGVEYRSNSSLLIVNPQDNLPNDSEQVITTDFYVFSDSNLAFACRLPGAPGPPGL